MLLIQTFSLDLTTMRRLNILRRMTNSSDLWMKSFKGTAKEAGKLQKTQDAMKQNGNFRLHKFASNSHIVMESFDS